MPLEFKPIITKAGVDAIGRASASRGSLKLEISHVGLGRDSYDATGAEDRLKSEIGRYAVADGAWEEGRRLHLTVLVSNVNEAFDVGEIGIYTKDGVLFAIESKKGQVITRKLSHDDLLISFDLVVDSSLRDKIEVTGPGVRFNLSVADEFAEIAKMYAELQQKIAKNTSELEIVKARLAILEGRS